MRFPPYFYFRFGRRAYARVGRRYRTQWTAEGSVFDAVCYFFVTGSIAQGAGIYFTQRPILRFFAPQGRHVAPMGVKFGTEERTVQTSPPSVQRLGYRTPKLKFLLRFDQNVEYKRPAGAYPLRDFHKICRVRTSFQDALGVKISLDLLKVLRSYMGFKLRGPVTPKFSAPPSGETVRQTPKVFEVQERARGPLSPCIYYHAKFGGARISPAAGVVKNVFCLFVCVFVCWSRF